MGGGLWEEGREGLVSIRGLGSILGRKDGLKGWGGGGGKKEGLKSQGGGGVLLPS